ncbi:uncharacterized protein LOC141614060 [Silene latifolia]|uniref:uncharacterized protein LOC141614060 n=1 Tax=Silene latifolia TaxID=37657 RepID=UPI003D770255
MKGLGVPSPIPRFQVKFFVTYEDPDLVEFVIWDDVMVDLLGKTAQAILDEDEMYSVVPPPDFRPLLDRTFVAKIRVTYLYNIEQKSNSFGVISLCDDPRTIAKWDAMNNARKEQMREIVESKPVLNSQEITPQKGVVEMAEASDKSSATKLKEIKMSKQPMAQLKKLKDKRMQLHFKYGALRTARIGCNFKEAGVQISERNLMIADNTPQSMSNPRVPLSDITNVSHTPCHRSSRSTTSEQIAITTPPSNVSNDPTLSYSNTLIVTPNQLRARTTREKRQSRFSKKRAGNVHSDVSQNTVNFTPATSNVTEVICNPTDVVERLVRDLCAEYGEPFSEVIPSVNRIEQSPGSCVFNASYSHGESSRTQQNTSVSLNNDAWEGYWDCGDAEYECEKCHALMWFEERKDKRRGTRRPKFSLCCSDGKVELTFLQQPPELIKSLLTGQHRFSSHYRENIRAYNSMFSFTSMGGKIDHSINQGDPSRFNDELIRLLENMIDSHNTIAKTFRKVRDRLSVNTDSEVSIKLISRRLSDGRTYNLPTVSEVAALIEGDIGPHMEKRDIIVRRSCGGLQRISELHPLYTPLQYPLLIPFGEDRYRPGILHSASSIGVSTSDQPREETTCREWFAYHLIERPPDIEFPMILLSGKALHQFLVDCYMLVESYRLNFIRFNQDRLRVDNYKNLSNAVGRGDVEPSSAVVYTIEFQKRGLPHAHIVLFLHREDKFPTAADVDKIISAEIPDPTTDPVLHSVVCEYMLHGPCGKAKPSSPCMVGDKCSKYYPKPCTERTTVDGDGYPINKRSKKGVTVIKDDVPLENDFVIPYNSQLLLKYRAHINVEWCNQSTSIKYLFKYINKGSDRVTMQSSYTRHNEEDPGRFDEIKRFYDCRYLSACEATWRIFGFDIHYRTPAVERLQYHLPDEQPIVFHDDDWVDEVVENTSLGVSQFLNWMGCNNSTVEEMQVAKELLYCEFPTKFVWKKKLRQWSLRKKGFTIGRLVHVPPQCGELYFMRVMLNHVKGPKCFDDIRTVNHFVHPTFREACYALGLIGDDREYIAAINEAVIEVRLLLEKFLTDEELQNYALIDIDNSLQINGSSLRRFEEMPFPNMSAMTHHRNSLVMDALSYDKQSLSEEHEIQLSSMTDEQRLVFNEVMEAALNNKGGVFFVYGYGGTGKTFLWRSLCACFRSKGDIVVVVASSGIAATLIPGGVTAHSRFGISINVTEDSICSRIKPGSDLAELLIRAKLIIWDEAPMTHRHCFEALDKSLKDVMRVLDVGNVELPFGGKVVVFGGDFRQTLPVVSKGSRADVVVASLCLSYLWSFCKVLRLTKNMRLQVGSSSDNVEELRKFSEWLLEIGDGIAGGENDGEVDLELPADLLIQDVTNPIKTLVDVTYPDLLAQLWNPEYLQQRAILAPTHEIVESVNEYVLSLIKKDERIYLSSDEVCSDDRGIGDGDIHSTEFLNSIKCVGLPNHQLKLKVGAMVMLLRNIDQSRGLCNGTRLIVTDLGARVIRCSVLTGSHKGDRVHIARLTLTPSDTDEISVRLRRQFPIAVCFAMTINKSQEQSLSQFIV